MGMGRKVSRSENNSVLVAQHTQRQMERGHKEAIDEEHRLMRACCGARTLKPSFSKTAAGSSGVADPCYYLIPGVSRVHSHLPPKVVIVLSRTSQSR